MATTAKTYCHPATFAILTGAPYTLFDYGFTGHVSEANILQGEATAEYWAELIPIAKRIGEHLPYFDLINMPARRSNCCLVLHIFTFQFYEGGNGRVYAPQLGRFLSPDPYVQAPDFTQNYNRYSYVLNNPLKYTDPTGYRYDSGQLRQEGADARYAPFPGQYNYPFGNYSGSYTGFGSAAGGTGSASSSYYYSWNTGTYYNSNHQPVEWGEVRDNYVTPNSYTYDGWWQTVRIPAHPELGKYISYFVKEKRINYYAPGYNGCLLINMDLNSTAANGGGWDLNGDGHLTLREANNWYRNGNGQAITVDATRINITNVNPNELSSTRVTPINFQFRGPTNFGLTYGTLDLTLVGNNQVSIEPNMYDFDIGAAQGHPWFGRGVRGFVRNVGTLGGNVVARSGTPFMINFDGNATLNYQPYVGFDGNPYGLYLNSFMTSNSKNMNMIKYILLINLLIFISACGAGTGDGTKELSGGYVLRLDGSMSYIIPDNIFNEGIYPNVKSFAYNEDFILVYQLPSEELIKLFLSQDIRRRFNVLVNVPDTATLSKEDYELMKSSLLADSSFYRMLSKELSPNNTTEDRLKTQAIVQHIIDTSFYYQTMINSEANYWIINHIDGKKYGPLSKDLFFMKAKELGVPDDLKQEFEEYIK